MASFMQDIIVKIGTRSSALAMAQAYLVRDALEAAHGWPRGAAEIVPMSTQGDRVQDRALSAFGGKGLFTQEIEAALAEKRIDIAVHSAKDLAAELPKGLALSAFLKREDPRDAFIGAQAARLRDLPQGAKIGTSSIRRQALLRRARPDIEICLLRGNVQTRLDKLEKGEVDGTFLALAGLKRLGLADKLSEILPPEQFAPAPAQGVIAIESRADDARINALLAPMNDRATALTTFCERGFMAALDGSCRTPLGAYAELRGTGLHLRAMIISPDGCQMHELAQHCPLDPAEPMADKAAENLGRAAALELRGRAGAAFFTDWQ